MDIRARVNGLSASRRRVLTGAAAGGGLLAAFWLWPRALPDPLLTAPGEHGFGGWLKIAEDGVVTLAVPQLEMGQGVLTVLAQVAATELGADWRQMGVEMAPPAALYANAVLAAHWAPLWDGADAPLDTGAAAARDFARDTAFCATADGTSLAAYEDAVRAAAASARAVLVAAAAERWSVPEARCTVAAGLVSDGRRRIGFGPLASAAARLTPPDEPPLNPRPAAEIPLRGEGEAASSLPRLDLPAKVDGSLPFAGDIRLPNMVHASIRLAPWGDYTLHHFDAAAGWRVRGVRGIVKAQRWLAAAADSWWAADRALAAMRPVFTGPPGPDSAGFAAALAAALDDGENAVFEQDGDPEDRLARPALARRYTIAAAPPAPLETASATARFEGGRLTVWMAAQSPAAARAAAAKAVGLAPEAVALIPVAAGGSFDARLESAVAIQAAILARELARPVQLTWPRHADMQGAPVRPAMLIDLAAAFVPGSGGQLDAWRVRVAAPSAGHEFAARHFENRTPLAAMAAAQGRPDPEMVRGAVPPYALPHRSAAHYPVALGVPAGRMRGNAPAAHCFASEVFVDELAEQAGRDPFLYRMTMLGQNPRLAEALGEATRAAGWDGGGRGTGQGLACAEMALGDARGRIACVAEAALRDGRIAVSRLTAVVDIGRIVNIGIARQQIEGGLLFGMAQAAGNAVRFARGRLEPRGLAGLAWPRLAATPEIRVEFLAGDAPPFDPGELGVLVAAPAIANALYASTGQRYRALPFLAETP